jgi:hypothetical protein
MYDGNHLIFASYKKAYGTRGYEASVCIRSNAQGQVKCRLCDLTQCITKINTGELYI